jgi:O-antigen ligase
LLLPAVIVVALALRGGGYDVVTTNALGLLSWLAVLAAVAFARPPARVAWLVGCSILAFTVWVGLSTLWSESAELSFAEFDQASTYLALFVATVLACQRLGGTARIVNGLTIGMAIVLGLALMSRLDPSLFPDRTLVELVPDARPRLSYPLNYWNGVAQAVAMSVPLFMHLWLNEAPPRWLRAVGVALLPAAGLTLYFTFSRGGIVCTVAAAAVLVAATPRRLHAVAGLVVGGVGAAALAMAAHKGNELNDGLLSTDAAQNQGHKLLLLTIGVTVFAWLVATQLDRLLSHVQAPAARTRGVLAVISSLAVVLALAVAASANLGDRLESLKGSTDTASATTPNVTSRYLSGNSNGRVEYWKAAYHAWEAHPLVGIGSGAWILWWQRHPTVANFVRDPHSLWFEVAGELGTIGFLLTFAMFATILWAGFRAVRSKHDVAAPALLAVAVTFVVGVSFDWTWELTSLGGLFFVAAGLLVGRAGQAEKQSKRADAYPSRLGRGVFVALIAWVSIFAMAVPLLSTWQLDRSQAAVRHDDLNSALHSAQTAHSIQPWASGPSLQLAQVLALSNKIGDARRYAIEGVKREPTNWATWLVLSRVERQAGDTALADRYLAQAYNLNPASYYWIQTRYVKP